MNKCSAIRYCAAIVMKCVLYGCDARLERNGYRCAGLLGYFKFIGNVECCTYVDVVVCLSLDTLGGVTGMRSGTVFCTLGSGTPCS